MKKIYFPALTLLFVVSFCSYGQNVIMGSNMEDFEEWEVSLLNTDVDNTVEYEFGYTDIIPAEGDGGCLYVSGTNTGEAGGMLTNIMFYQILNLQRGVTYIFDGAYKDLRTNNYWTEVWVGGNEPQEGSDYDANVGAVRISGFKSKNWEATCLTDTFDGTFLNDACMADATNEVFFEGEGDTIVYFGFRSGIWDDQGNGYSFEVFFDNISLTPQGGSVIGDMNTDKFVIAPSPFIDHFTISSGGQIKEVLVLNVVGQPVYRLSDLQSSHIVINLADAEPGIYFISLTDRSGNTFIRKTIKL
jgi:hypothetical protein